MSTSKTRPPEPTVDAETLRELSGCTCFHLRKATRTITRVYDRALADLGLRSTQFAVLSAIAGSSRDATVSDIAAWLGMDHSTLVRNLRPLRQSKLITSKRGRDRRTRMLALTDLGAELLARAVPVWRDVQAQVLEHIGHEAWAHALEALRATYGIEDALLDDAAPAPAAVSA